jgi:hypothetical protein
MVEYPGVRLARVTHALDASVLLGEVGRRHLRTLPGKAQI